MTVSRKLIENVEELRKALNEISVYDFDVYTSMELYYKIANKLNEVIKELMRFEGLVSDEVIKQNEKLIYLLGEGLNIEVVKKINQMVQDGTMDSIINHNVFNSLNNKIDEYKEELSSQIKDIENNNFNYINLKDFLTDGANFSTALTNAINYCNNNDNNCKRIAIPDGNYLLTETVKIYDYIEIFGASSTGTVILCDIPADTFAIEAETGAFRFKLSNLTLRPIDNKRKIVNGINCKNQRYSNINNCNIFYFDTAISFDGKCWVNYIEYCRFWNNNISIKENRTDGYEEANNFNIRSCEFYDGRTAIYGIAGRNINIISNVFERLECCIRTGTCFSPLIISQNYCESINNLLYVPKGDVSKNVVISENYFIGYNENDNVLINIETTTGDPTIKYLTIRNNFFNGNHSNVKELISLNDNYTVDFYENCFSNKNSKKIDYYLDLFTTDSTYIPIKNSRFNCGKSDLFVLNLYDNLGGISLTKNRSLNCYVELIKNQQHGKGLLHLVIRGDVTTFNDDITIPKSITPYESSYRYGVVTYSDNTLDVVRVQIASDQRIRIRGYDSSKQITRIDIDTTYGNYGTGVY